MKLRYLIISIALLAAPATVLAVDTGAVVGGAVGGGAGAAIGSEVGGKEGAIIGGAVGGAVGAAIGASDEKETVVVKERVIYKEAGHDHSRHPPGYHHGKKKGWKKHH